MKQFKIDGRRCMLAIIMLFTGVSAYSQTQQTVGDSTKYMATAHNVILTQLLKEKGFTNKSVEMMVVDFPPRSKSPAHRHPCPTFGYLISGEIVSVFEGKTYHYKAGDSFYETPNGLHSDARNDSFTQPAKLLVVYVKDSDKPTVIPAVHKM
ncbi:cupin domain-containing protein [Mucilaginibacter sp.]|uniref:cupin domain-containing protein n=1 Tax=Mucilaginibacter sp. TaxID=1882438 RepID=UPI0025CCF915|nr:cupin domain-containing protein [Mucilaginibacter sp.]